MDFSSSAYSGIGAALYTAGMVGAWLYLRGRATPPYQEQFQTAVASVSKLYVYPVKSCHRLQVDSIDCWKRGLRYDRTFVVVEKTGQFVSQRAYPRMAQVQPHLDVTSEEEGVSLRLNAPGMEEIEVKIPSEDCKPTSSNVKVWSMSGEGVEMGEELGAWFSRYLDKEGLRVYYMSPLHKPRFLRTDQRFSDISHHGDESSFSDFAPVLIASEASMDLLNSKMKEPLEIERFRPNIIIKDCLAHAEDNWSELRIGPQLVLRNLKPCSRCKMTTVDQEKGVFSPGEPLNTLIGYRLYAAVYGNKDERFGGSPMFGAHYSVTKVGVIKVDDVLCTKNMTL